ncbi:MAG TPA: glycosyltransferase [Gemmataceae bacterium]|nr:glycosyltransferase [Gemmataceae bacterium]
MHDRASTIPSGRRIVVTTFGSLGDLHPYLALGLGLKARGHDVIVGTGECYRRKIETLGLGFRAVRPDCAWVEQPEVMRRIAHPRWGIIRAVRMLMDALHESYADTLEACERADLVVGNMAAYATRLVAEKTGIPWASAMHIPTGFFSACDPPLIPGFPGFSKALRPLGPLFWGPFGRFVNRTMYWAANPWFRLRREIGLPAVPSHNPLTESFSPLLHLALFSKRLVDKQRDWPQQTLVTGFPWFNADSAAGLPPALAEFLEDGSAPIVFTLGTAIAADAGTFFETSIRAAQLLGRRAVLILKDPRNRPRALPDGVAAFEYAAFPLLFPRAAAIVHHGGIGTTGLAMRSGRPTLIMPCAWDQPDNAERAARLGISRTISRRRYTPERVAIELRRLLDEPAYGRRAAEIGEQVRQEDGVRAACDAVERALRHL